MGLEVKLLPTDDPMLHKPARPCPKSMVNRVSNKLFTIYYTPPWGVCAGMAAPQIGYPYRMFVAKGMLFVNPKAFTLMGQTYETTEGCFSIPGKVHRVKRYEKVQIDIDSQLVNFSGYMAQVIQHEYDHIMGVLISDREKELEIHTKDI